MPRTTDLRKYPPEFEHLLQRAATGMVEFTFPTSAKAMRFRHRFYAYMKLLRDTNARPDLTKQAIAVGIRMSEDRCSLSIGPEHDSWEGELIRGVLGFERGAPTAVVLQQQEAAATAHAGHLRKLAEIRARKT